MVRHEVRPATAREIEMFLERVEAPAGTTIVVAEVALIGLEIVAIGGLRQSDGRLHGFLNVVDGIPPRLGLMIVRALRAGIKRCGAPVETIPFIHVYGEKTRRLLTYLGFDLSAYGD